MAYIRQCNICGKFENEKGVKFSDNQLSLNIPSYNGKNYNIHMIFDVIYDKDEDKINELKEKYKNMDSEMLLRKMLKQDLYNEPVEIIKLEEPYPLICDKCKKGIAYLMFQFGMVGKPIKF